jgi:small GTP-binding protein
MTTTSTRYPPVRIALAGGPGVGKSTLLQRLRNQDRDDELRRTEPTIGIDFAVWQQQVSRADTRMIEVHVFDLAGSQRFEPITSTYFKNADGIVLMCDLTSRDSFHDLGTWWWPRIENFAPKQEEPPHRLRPTMLLVGNKLDLVERAPSARHVPAADLQAFVNAHKDDGVYGYIECSTLHWSIERDLTPFDTFLATTASRLPLARWVPPPAPVSTRAAALRVTNAVAEQGGEKQKTACC